MDSQEMADWRAFCKGEESFSPDHFSRMFMETFLEPLTDGDKKNLCELFSYVPNSARVVEKMLRLDARADDRSEEEIVALVRNDLAQMCVIGFDLSAPIGNSITFATDERQFDRARQGRINRNYILAISDFISDRMTGSDDKIYALSEAFYGLASDMHLQSALTADLLNLDVRFDNYFELYLIGVNYALDETNIVVANYRRLRATGNSTGEAPR